MAATRLRNPRQGAVIAVLSGLLVLFLLLAGCADRGPGSTSATSAGSATTAAQGSHSTTENEGSTAASAGTGSTASSSQGASVASGAQLVSPAEAVAEKVGPSVVNVRVKGVQVSPFFGNEPYEGVGSGVIYSAEGYIVTNEHVISQNGRPASSIEVTFSDGSTAPATIVGRDSFTDIAVIKVNKTGLPVAAFGSSSDVNIGEYCIAIGSPLDYKNSVTLGIVSGIGRSIQDSGSTALVDLLQIDAAISPGNSGGAVLDASGRVIGIAVAYLSPQRTGAENIGFAIPVDTVTDVADQLIESGSASHPYVGIEYRTVTSDLQQYYRLSRSSGALLTDVGSGTPAAKAGLRQGDILLKVDGTEIKQDADIVVALRHKKVGETIEFEIDRDGKTQIVKVTLAERPASF